MQNYSEEEAAKQFIQSEEQEETPNSQVNKPIINAPAFKSPFAKSEDQISLGNQLGYQKIPIEDLPTQGLFYPEGTEIVIRAANGAEIRHWSTLSENPNNPNYYSQLDDMLNYILERCVTIRYPAGMHSSWKDLKEVDRFYLILAVKEYTFIKGENKLQVTVAEGKKIDVNKNMIDYINFDDRIIKYYDKEKRCLMLRFKTGKVIPFHIPSVGVVQWVKHYVQRKQQYQQPVDEDFVNYAQFIIGDWRGLNDITYEEYASSSYGWSIGETSGITKIKDMLIETINPVIKYHDEGGMERTAPLNFQGGFKSLFIVSDPFGELE